MEYFLFLTMYLRSVNDGSLTAILVLTGALIVLAALVALGFHFRKYVSFVFKSVRRNLLRSMLTGWAIMVLVFVVTLVWSFLVVLDIVMTERAKDLKAIVTERWQVPSQMPFAYAASLEEGAYEKPGDVRPNPEDSMTWQFYGGTLDATSKSWENFMFFFALDPRKLRTMMDDLENLDQDLVDKLVANKRGAIVGRTRLEKINKRVGERFTVTSVNAKGLDLEFEIVGVFPEGRYDQSAVMNRDYLNDAFDAYARNTGKKHPLAEKSLGLVWLRLKDQDAFNKVADQITSSARFSAPAVKFETASSGISSFLEPYRDLLWGLKWLLVPALLATMALVIANAISISVRERRTEMAVLKVLGYGPGRILALVLGEALLVGAGSGFLSALLTYGLIHVVLGGIKFPISFIPMFDVYIDALWWGVLFGGVTAFVGSIIPAWSARTVKVSEVFAKVA
jgi:putative ABC transport system permease protein